MSTASKFSGMAAAALLAACTYFGITAPAKATNLAFTGHFVTDNEVDTETFALTAGTYTLTTKSYAGGTLFDGITLPVGGFDPILTLFAGATVSGAPLAFNDDGGPSLVATDPNTGRAWDSYINIPLSAGTYTVAISEYNNFWNAGTQMWAFPNPPGNNFTSAFGCSNGSFCDVSGAAPFNNRTNQYGWQITAAPEPVSIALLGTGLIGLAVARRRKKRA